MWRSIVRCIVTLAIAILAVPHAPCAQQPKKIPRIGALCPTVCGGPLYEIFLQGLHELGWVEGQNIVIEHRNAEGKFDRLPDLAAELVRLNVDVIVTAATQGAKAAQRATSTIPIVFAGVGEPVEDGLIASYARPGGNLTGWTFATSDELPGKLLELLKEAMPGVSRVAVVWNPPKNPRGRVLDVMKRAAQALAMQLHFLEVRGPDEFDSAFSAMAKERVGALVVLQDPMLFSQRTRLAAIAVKSRLPVAFQRGEGAEAGGLMAYGPSAWEMFRRSAYYVDRILKGAKPTELPVEQPMRFELVINLKTAQALGITIPPSLLIRADKVIQ